MGRIKKNNNEQRTGKTEIFMVYIVRCASSWSLAGEQVSPCHKLSEDHKQEIRVERLINKIYYCRSFELQFDDSQMYYLQ